MSSSTSSPLSDLLDSPPPLDPSSPKHKKRKITTTPRKTKKQQVAEVVYPVRNTTSALRIGAHVSTAGGVDKAVGNAARIGANAFALFLKSQRKWESPPIPIETSSVKFPDACKAHGYDPKTQILPHGSYLVNLANPNEAAREKSYACFLDDLKRCQSLGIGLFNIHPGSALKGNDRSQGCIWVAEGINKALKETEKVCVVLENMAGQGEVLGSHHKDLRDIIELVEDKTRIGICIDTCHLFASASTHTLSPSTSLHTTLSTLNSHVPLRSYLKALHLNDSKFPVGSKKDRHENLGLGEIGLEGFWALMRWEGPDGERSEEQGQAWWGKGGGGEGVVMVLETPNAENEEVWKREIELLYQLEAITDPSLLPAIQSAWRAECTALKAAGVAKKTKASEAKKEKKKVSAAAAKGKDAKTGKGKRKKGEEEDSEEDGDEEMALESKEEMEEEEEVVKPKKNQAGGKGKRRKGGLGNDADDV